MDRENARVFESLMNFMDSWYMEWTLENTSKSRGKGPPPPIPDGDGGWGR